MKLNKLIYLGVSLGILGASSIFAEDKSQKTDQQFVEENLEKVLSSFDEDTKALLKQLLDDSNKAKTHLKDCSEKMKKLQDRSKKIQMMIHSPDGKTVTVPNDAKLKIKLDDIVTQEGDDIGVKARVASEILDASVTMIGPDGKAVTTTIDLGESGDLNEIIRSVTEEFADGSLEIEEQVTSVGPGLLRSALSKEKNPSGDLEEIKNELAAQRKILEKILKKLK